VQERIINTISLFSGGGGLDLGFASAGYNIALSSDIDYYSCKTLEINQNKRSYYQKHPVINDDVKNLNKDLIMKTSGIDRVDFLIGGPPCQAFSVFGRRKGLEDPRGGLIYQYARIVEELQPEGFLFENVSGLKTINDGDILCELTDFLSFDGHYKVAVNEYDVVNYGVPQSRRRIIIIGSRKQISRLEPTHGILENNLDLFKLHPYNTVGLALKGLPPYLTSWTETPNINAHVGRIHSERIRDRYASLDYGERDTKTRINKLDPNKPSFTIIVGSDKGGGKGHIHPYENREVTPRESARLQTFPDWWYFHGTGRHVIRQVGNAVPPLFAAQIAIHVKKELFGVNEEVTYSDIVDRLGLAFLSCTQ
jgi:DNA (cytosine-5)-methyltransferase 1